MIRLSLCDGCVFNMIRLSLCDGCVFNMIRLSLCDGCVLGMIAVLSCVTVVYLVCNMCVFLLRQYILNEREVETKTVLWMKQNEDYLKEQQGQMYLHLELHAP